MTSPEVFRAIGEDGPGHLGTDSNMTAALTFSVGYDCFESPTAKHLCLVPEDTSKAV